MIFVPIHIHCYRPPGISAKSNATRLGLPFKIAICAVVSLVLLGGAGAGVYFGLNGMYQYKNSVKILLNNETLPSMVQNDSDHMCVL